MVKTFLKTTLRSLTKNKSYTLINVAGLSLGIVCALTIFLIIKFEFSFDTFHEHAENIYRVVRIENQYGEIEYDPGVPYPLPAAMRTDFPEISHLTIVDHNFGAPVVSVEQDSGSVARFKEEKVAFVSPDYFRIFSYEWLLGNPEKVLESPGSVVISAELARKYFGDTNPIGRALTLRTSNTYPLQITGVFTDVPKNSDLPFSMLIAYEGSGRGSDNWGSTSTSTQCYLRLPENVDPHRLENRFHEFLTKHRSKEAAETITLRLQPLSEVHFDTRFENYRHRTVARETLLALALIGVFLVATGCINFINLNTALAIKRSKEVGVRKVLGSTRTQLVLHYLAETAVITLFAILISLPLTELAVVNLNAFMEFGLEFDPFQNLNIPMFLLALFGVVTIVAGFYPAQYLSGFSPIEAIRNKINISYGEGLSLRKGLVVVQFAISQVLIVSTIVITSQIDYFRKVDVGFNDEAIVEVGLPRNEHGDLIRLKNELLQHPSIKHVSFSNTGTASENIWGGDYTFLESGDKKEGHTQIKFVDHDFIKTYDLELLAGEGFAESDTLEKFVVNETFVQDVGHHGNYSEVIGKFVKFWGREAPIAGVVKDFNTTSLHQEMGPVILVFQNRFWQAGVKIDMRNLKTAISTLEEAWTSVYPQYVFEYEFLSDTIEAFYEQEKRTAHLVNTFTAIAILIGCLGLFGLVSYMATQRTKEIGIRKVLGATFSNILGLFSREFAILISLAFLFAGPVAYLLMQAWLEDFAYRVDLGTEKFIVALLASFVIAFSTVGFRSARAATSNPVDSLRDE